MSREKIKYLFRKNHIEIFKIENPDIPIPKIPTFEQVTSALHYKRYCGYLDQKREEYKTIKKESPLGFYYTKKVKVSQLRNYQPAKTGSVSRTIVTIPLPNEDNTYYQIKYVTEYEDNKIGGEDGLRPWDIYPGDKDFPDHMLDALVKEVNDFFNIISENDITSFSKNPSSLSYGVRDNMIDTHFVKTTVFKELFGNINGPRFQTNEEKILAHGFDLKYSFRKDKETK